VDVGYGVTELLDLIGEMIPLVERRGHANPYTFAAWAAIGSFTTCYNTKNYYTNKYRPVIKTKKLRNWPYCRVHTKTNCKCAICFQSKMSYPDKPIVTLHTPTEISVSAMNTLTSV
jgi:hypothetical protein